MSRRSLSERITEQALALGFDAVGFAAAELAPEARTRLRDFLDSGAHGEMGWLADRVDERAEPRRLWPQARSVIVTGLSYAPDDDPLAALARRDRGSISVYARNRDYHDIIKGRLKHLAQFVVRIARDADNERIAREMNDQRVARDADDQRVAREMNDQRAARDADDQRVARGTDDRRDTGGREPQAKVFVDTAPVMEKPLAERARLGWQGKHTNLVSRRHGSWLLLGEIYTTLELPPSEPTGGRCGSCTACLQACPTDAFPAPYRLDARRCISYLTIEHAGEIPHALRPAIGNRIYGCDDCLAACPWNRFAQSARELKLRPREELRAPRLAELARLDDAAFRRLFSASPVKRIGRDRFVRNVLIAIGNSADPCLLDAARPLQHDPNPVVAEAARWAVERLGA